MLHLLIETCAHRRVAVAFFTLVVAAFGLYAYLNTPIEAYPDVTNTQVTVITQLPGNAPEEIERRVTVPLERELNGTPGMTLMRSESLFGLSLITMTFADDVNTFPATRSFSGDLGRRAAAGATPELAPEATPLGEVYQFRVTSDRHDLYQLRSEMQWNVVRVLRQAPGVADIVPFGGYLKEVHIEADPARLYALGLSLGDLEQAIGRSNLNVGGGFLRHGDQEVTVRGIGYLESAEDIKNILLKSKDGTAVRGRRGEHGAVGPPGAGVTSVGGMRVPVGCGAGRIPAGARWHTRQIRELHDLSCLRECRSIYDRSDSSAYPENGARESSHGFPGDRRSGLPYSVVGPRRVAW